MSDKKIVLGWREWLGLPDLGLEKIKAKIDTGAKTSALHAFSVEPFYKDDVQWVKFAMHPIQGDTETEVVCTAPVFDVRDVTDSGGHTESRYVIQTRMTLGDESFVTELTLTNRDTMKFRMLLGRNSMNDRCMVDPVKSFLLGRFQHEINLLEDESDNLEED